MNPRKVLLFAACALLLLVMSRALGWSRFLTDDHWLHQLRAHAQNRLFAAALLYLGFTAAACVLLALPGVTFAVVAGVLFGPWLGSLLCLVGTTMGAVLSFLAGRYFLKESVKPAAMKNAYLRKVLFDGEGENEILLLMLTRLLPFFPFNLQNFAYGITDISVVKYTLFTFVFMIPGVCFFTLATAGILSEGDKRLLWAAVAIAAVLLAVGLWARRVYRNRYS